MKQIKKPGAAVGINALGQPGHGDKTSVSKRTTNVKKKSKPQSKAGESRTANADLYKHYSKPKAKSQVAAEGVKK
jgi:hypothetical protein